MKTVQTWIFFLLKYLASSLVDVGTIWTLQKALTKHRRFYRHFYRTSSLQHIFVENFSQKGAPPKKKNHLPAKAIVLAISAPLEWHLWREWIST